MGGDGSSGEASPSDALVRISSQLPAAGPQPLPEPPAYQQPQFARNLGLAGSQFLDDLKTMIAAPAQQADIAFDPNASIGQRLAAGAGAVATIASMAEPGAHDAPPRGIPAGEGFMWNAKPMEDIQNLPASGVMPESRFATSGSETGSFSKDELALMKQMVPDAFTQGGVDVPALHEGLAESGPVVEVKKLGAVESTPETQRMSEIRHELDTRFPNWGDRQQNPRIFARSGEEVSLTDELNNLTNAHLDSIQIGGGTGSKAQYAFVGPKPENQMPGYVEGLVQGSSPTGETFLNDPHFSGQKNTISFYRGHEETIPKDSQGNTVDFKDPKALIRVTTPGKSEFEVGQLVSRNEFERVANRLEAAHWPAPTGENGGEKALNLIEAQTDIIFDHQNGTFSIRDHPELGSFNSKNKAYQVAAREVHPMYADGRWQELSLKAAIQHAKEIGATKVILPDAETAMMTEGHDNPRNLEYKPVAGAQPVKVTKPSGYNFVTKLPEGWQWQPDIHSSMAINPEGKPFTMFSVDPRNDYEPITTENIGRKAPGSGLYQAETWAVPVEPKIPQEGGMRLHYDQTLPSAMRKLTGDKGQPIDLGTHKGAERQGAYADTPEGLRSLQEITGGVPIQTPDGKWRLGGSPVFKDASGNPKTNITGKIYDISKTPDKFKLMKAGDKASAAKYQVA